MDETYHRNMRMWTAGPTTREIISAINARKRSKAVGVDGLPAEFFFVAFVITKNLLLLFVLKCWKSEVFLREFKKFTNMNVTLGGVSA